MEDNEIIEMFWKRNEAGLRAAQEKYGGYLYRIAFNILGSPEDSNECVNDTYFKAWGSIPPKRPEKLPAYLGTIVRNISITMYRQRNTASRAGSQYTLSLSELGDCVSGGDYTSQQTDLNLLAGSISNYLRTLPSEQRNVFMCRYYFNDSIKDIAGFTGSSETKIKSMLLRVRKGLAQYLTGQGFTV